MNLEASLIPGLQTYEKLITNNQLPLGQKQAFAKVMAQNKAEAEQKISVKDGDTVSQLAVDYNTSIDAIVRMNHLNDPNLILTGQTLQIKTNNNNGLTSSVQTEASQRLAGKNNLGQDVVTYAKNFLGDAYVWGQAKPGTFDCSGLVSYVYQKFGVKVPHLAQAQADQTQHIATKDAQPGDLLFWQNKQGHVYHVALAMGNGHYVNALNPEYGVRIDGMAKPADFAGKIS